MKKILFLLFMMIGLSVSMSAKQSHDIVYLKNGSVIRGTIVEMYPNVSLKIETPQNCSFTYSFSDIEKVVKEQNKIRKSETIFDLDAFDDFKSIECIYKGFFDAGYVLDNGGDWFEFTTTHGCQLNPYIFLGIGVGLDCYIWEYSRHYKVHKLSMPLFANVRVTPFNNAITPFWDVKLGYSVFDVEGFCFTPSVGLRLALTDRMGLNVGVGYSMQMYKNKNYIYNYDNYYYGEISETAHGLNIKLGVDF